MGFLKVFKNYILSSMPKVKMNTEQVLKSELFRKLYPLFEDMVVCQVRYYQSFFKHLHLQRDLQAALFAVEQINNLPEDERDFLNCYKDIFWLVFSITSRSDNSWVVQ